MPATDQQRPLQRTADLLQNPLSTKGWQQQLLPLLLRNPLRRVGSTEQQLPAAAIGRGVKVGQSVVF